MINWTKVISNNEKANKPLSFSQFKRQRQKNNPRTVGKPTELGYLSHQKAYDSYLKEFYERN